MENQQRQLPEDIVTLVARLVAQGQIRIAGTVMYVFFRRNWRLDDEIAAAYMVKYFEKHHAEQLHRHRRRMAKA